MIPKGLFTQIGMIIVSVAIVITYVQPAFTEIGEVQNSIEVYKSERIKVQSVNAQLSSLVSRLESVSNDDNRKLHVYIPDKIDEVAIRRDLLLIAEESGTIYSDSSYGGGSGRNNRNRQPSDTDVNNPEPHTFSLSVEGTYGQLKNLFKLLGQNNYPLEVSSANISQLQGDFLSAEIDLTTYSYKVLDVNQ